jgi:hypothetical protein
LERATPVALVFCNKGASGVSRGPDLLNWFSKREILKYDGLDVAPIITTIDPHTVRISITSIERVRLAKDRWQDVTILYDIGHIGHPSARDPPPGRAF